MKSIAQRQRTIYFQQFVLIFYFGKLLNRFNFEVLKLTGVLQFDQSTLKLYL